MAYLQSYAAQSPAPNSTTGGVDANNPSSILGTLGNELGTNDTFTAQQAPTANATYNGPGVNQLGGTLAGYQGQAGAAAGLVQGADRSATGGYLNSLSNYGTNTGAAQGMLQAGTNAANASALSLARSAGGSPAAQAAALRNASQTASTNITGAGAQAAQLQAQQQGQALQMQGSALQNQTATDLQQQQLANQMAGQYLGAQLNASGQDLQAQTSNNQINSGNFNSAQQINAGVAASNAQANSSMLGGVVGAAGGLAMMSDVRAKTDIAAAGAPRPGGTTAADSFLAHLKPYEYNYKRAEDEPTGEPHGGRYLGVMAQDVERTPTGSTLVADTPRGKAIEGNAAIGAALAGLGRLHERVSALESRKGAQR